MKNLILLLSLTTLCVSCSSPRILNETYFDQKLKIELKNLDLNTSDNFEGIYFMSIMLKDTFIANELSYVQIANLNAEDSCIQYSNFVFDSLGHVYYHTEAVDKIDDPWIIPNIDHEVDLNSSQLVMSTFNSKTLVGKYFRDKNKIHMVLDRPGLKSYLCITGEFFDNDSFLNLTEISQKRFNYSPLKSIKNGVSDGRIKLPLDSLFSIDLKFKRIEELREKRFSKNSVILQSIQNR